MTEIKEEMQHLLCPITQEIMTEPVVAADGHTYEKKAIEAWLYKNMTSPLTNLPLSTNTLIPNHLIKSLIVEYKEKNQENQEKNQENKEKNQESKEPEVKIPKSTKKCFLGYSELSKTQKEKMERALIEFEKSSKLKCDTPEGEWEIKSGDIYKTYEWLSQLELKSDSYDYLSTEFKQYLSYKTQEQRHALKDAKGKHPAVKQFWQMNEKMQLEWFKDFVENK